MNQDHPQVVTFPPALFALGLLVGGLLQWLRPVPIPGPGWLTWLGPPAVALGVALAIWARRRMSAAGTDPNPFRATTAIVASGPYRVTRNPMYVAMAIAFVGIALWTRAAILLAMLVPVVLVLHFGIVRREEGYLEVKFGDVYRDYRRRVRRYL